MRRVVLLAVTSLLMAGLPLIAQAAGAASQHVPCVTDCFRTGDNEITVVSGGKKRSFLVYVPKSYTGRSRVPLMLYLHGFTGSAAGTRAEHQDMQVPEADKRGHILIFPQGYKDSWNGDNCCGDAFNEKIDDVAFLRAVVRVALTRAAIDPARVYIAGESNGAAMAHRFGCQAADVVRAVIAISHRLSRPDLCRPSKPVTMFEIEGVLDTLVPYTGSGGFVSARDSFANWAAVNRCTGRPTRGKVSPEPAAVIGPFAPTVTITELDTYVSCARGVTVGLVTLPTGGHVPNDNHEGFRPARFMWEDVLTF